MHANERQDMQICPTQNVVPVSVRSPCEVPPAERKKSCDGGPSSNREAEVPNTQYLIGDTNEQKRWGCREQERAGREQERPCRGDACHRRSAVRPPAQPEGEYH